MKNKIGWPEALKAVVYYLVIGWVLSSIASCTARAIEAGKQIGQPRHIHAVGEKYER